MARPNDRLRVARERLPSPTYPEECLTRQELAERVNAYIWQRHHKMVALDANYLGKLERGVIWWPSRLYREALRAVLGVPSDTALGFGNARRSVVRLTNVDRQQFIRTSAALGVGTLALGPLAALLADSEPTPIPDRIGATDIGQVRAAARMFQSWDQTHGGGLVREAVRGQLRWSTGLLQASCPEPLQPELFSAVGDLAETAGYMAFDVYAHDEARQVLRFALVCAEQAGDWHLRGHVLSGMATQATETGRPDEGLTLAQHALVRADRLTATERAILFTNQARALAKMHRVRETRTAIGTADDHFAHSTPANDPPFLAYYTGARHAQYTGQALADLAIQHRDPSAATDRLTTALTGHTTGYARARVLTLTKLATLTMATGNPIEAAAIGNTALDAAETVRSRRTLDALRELARHAGAHQRSNEVADLRHRISTLLLTA